MLARRMAGLALTNNAKNTQIISKMTLPSINVNALAGITTANTTRTVTSTSLLSLSSLSSSSASSSSPFFPVNNKIYNIRSFSSTSTEKEETETETETPPPPPTNKNKTYALLPRAALSGGNRKIKLKPRVVKQRLSKLKTYASSEKAIRHSPWRMNLVCQFAAQQTVQNALMQLQFCSKMKAPLVAQMIERTARRAKHQDGIQMSQLEVVECFATHGTHLKRIKFMGRGRTGIKHRRFSHVRLVLREIDFDLKILQAHTLNEKKEWYLQKLRAEEDNKASLKEREELLALEKAAAEKKEREQKE